MVEDQGIGDRGYTHLIVLLVPCIFLPTDVLWKGVFPFNPKQSVGATVAFTLYAINFILLYTFILLICFTIVLQFKKSISFDYKEQEGGRAN